MTERRRKPTEYRMICSTGRPGDALYPARLMAIAEGYAMVRRPNGMPFVVNEQAWIDAPVRGA